MYGKELLPLIKSAGRADMFSENLWKWVRKHKDHPLFVAFSEKDGESYDEAKTCASRLYVGFHHLDGDGWLNGARLSEILCYGTKASEWAYPPGMKFTEIADWWEKYMERGKCFIDPEHTLYLDKERWMEEGNIRTCVWCGIFQQQEHVEMVPRKDWRPIETTPTSGNGHWKNGKPCDKRCELDEDAIEEYDCAHCPGA